MRCYWCDFSNFGDQIAPLLLRHYNFTPLLTPPKHATLVSTGSILEHLPTDYAGMILGAGFISSSSQMRFPKAKTLAVRGQLTKNRLGLEGVKSVLLGDPGLLASHVLMARESKHFALGVVPHYIDKRNTSIRKILQTYPNQVNLIDVQQRDPMVVFREIDKCEHILSSSLHGLIIADSLGIPSAWFYSAGLEGGRFKFDDYYSSLNISSSTLYHISGTETLAELLSTTTLKPRDRILQLKQDLDDAFLSLKTRR
jgi:pyruvyltransferase